MCVYIYIYTCNISLDNCWTLGGAYFVQRPFQTYAKPGCNGHFWFLAPPRTLSTSGSASGAFTSTFYVSKRSKSLEIKIVLPAWTGSTVLQNDFKHSQLKISYFRPPEGLKKSTSYHLICPYRSFGRSDRYVFAFCPLQDFDYGP